jgi:phage repressor protein C with HTH and peptisase S24 domain
MKNKGVTSTELAKRADVKTSFIYDIVSGKSTNPSTVKLARVAETLGVDLSYLVGGKGIRPVTRPAGDEYVTVPRIMVDVSAGSAAVVSMKQEDECYCFRKSWIRDHLGSAPSDMRTLHVRGDSMETTLSHNDIILVDTSKKNPSPPGIFVLFDGFGLVAKRLEFISSGHGQRIRIMSDNVQYSTYERSIEETFIIGRVVWFAREI